MSKDIYGTLLSMISENSYFKSKQLSEFLRLNFYNYWGRALILTLKTSNMNSHNKKKSIFLIKMVYELVAPSGPLN